MHHPKFFWGQNYTTQQQKKGQYIFLLGKNGPKLLDFQGFFRAQGFCELGREAQGLGFSRFCFGTLYRVLGFVVSSGAMAGGGKGSHSKSGKQKSKKKGKTRGNDAARLSAAILHLSSWANKSRHPDPTPPRTDFHTHSNLSTYFQTLFFCYFLWELCFSSVFISILVKFFLKISLTQMIIKQFFNFFLAMCCCCIAKKN